MVIILIDSHVDACGFAKYLGALSLPFSRAWAIQMAATTTGKDVSGTSNELTQCGSAILSLTLRFNFRIKQGPCCARSPQLSTWADNLIVKHSGRLDVEGLSELWCSRHPMLSGSLCVQWCSSGLRISYNPSVILGNT